MVVGLGIVSPFLGDSGKSIGEFALIPNINVDCSWYSGLLLIVWFRFLFLQICFSIDNRYKNDGLQLEFYCERTHRKVFKLY